MLRDLEHLDTGVYSVKKIVVVELNSVRTLITGQRAQRPFQPRRRVKRRAHAEHRVDNTKRAPITAADGGLMDRSEHIRGLTRMTVGRSRGVVLGNEVWLSRSPPSKPRRCLLQNHRQRRPGRGGSCLRPSPMPQPELRREHESGRAIGHRYLAIARQRVVDAMHWTLHNKPLGYPGRSSLRPVEL